MKEDIKNIIRTFEAVGPLVGNALKSGQRLNPQTELTEPDPDVLCEYDVKIPMSEGFSVTANIFRSKTISSDPTGRRKTGFFQTDKLGIT
jgi:hypothetical protein